ncbi:MAG: hypothetical protein ACRD0L_05870, partial [Acidimicrobiales bacterium]
PWREGPWREGPWGEGLDRARRALLWEHLLSWVPGFLSAVEDVSVAVGSGFYRGWAALAADALRAEAAALWGGGEEPRPLALPAGSRAGPAPPRLPLALRAAPPPLDGDEDLDGLIGALLAPARSGLVLTRARVGAIGAMVGTGARQGERRFALEAMIRAEPGATLEALCAEAGTWAGRHRSWAHEAGEVAGWWAGRAEGTAAALGALASAAAGRLPSKVRSIG